MTRDDILHMAEEAGIEFVRGWYSCVDENLERFAALVAAAEQDRCCRIVFGMCISDNNAQEIVDAIKAARGEKK